MFVEEWACGADLISPDDYRTLAWPFERELCRGLKELGLRAVFRFCSSAADRLDLLARLDADALAFEESKKGWTIDIGAVRQCLGPDRCLFGNIDAVLVRHGSPGELADEVRRQIDRAGPRAFATSIGSPLALGTAPEQLVS